MDVMVGEGEGESSINLVDLYFSFFTSTLAFFKSSLGFLYVTFDTVPLPQWTVEPFWNIFPTSPPFFSSLLLSSSSSSAGSLSTLRGHLQDFHLGVGMGVTSGVDKMIVMSASVGEASWDCIYICGCAVGRGFFSPWTKSGISIGRDFVVI